MAKTKIGPRLWLRQARHDRDGHFRAARWFIRDDGRHIATGCREDDRIGAEVALADYLMKKTADQEQPLYIYFVTARAPDFPVKIGITRSADSRFAALQTAIPYEIEVLAVMPITRAEMERILHGRFGHLRLRGEWFQRAPEILDFIESTRPANPA